MGKKSNNRGFTIIEVLIAISIFAIGFLSLAALQIKSVNSNTSARIQTEATRWAADRMERLLSLPYSDADLVAGTYSDTSEEGGYDISWSVTDDTPLAGTKAIRVTVTPPRSGARDVTLDFIKAP